MNIEEIKKVKLLVTLKGTDNEGKQTKWLGGTVFDKAIRPFPPNITIELKRMEKRKPPIFEILERYPKEVPKPVETAPMPEIPTPEEKAKEELEKPKTVPPKKKSRLVRKAK